MTQPPFQDRDARVALVGENVLMAEPSTASNRDSRASGWGRSRWQISGWRAPSRQVDKAVTSVTQAPSLSCGDPVLFLDEKERQRIRPVIWYPKAEPAVAVPAFLRQPVLRPRPNRP
jgi:hypothetical protein